ncbi:putative metalloprotease CJM1_0395 family protein [Azospirillum sp. A39]|uniref:putative metalloprotease CJM1_0395 family protein n=1 Tax=Azospirillum sp. A39 TaxID=3462279 RepID=UPI0040467A49
MIGAVSAGPSYRPIPSRTVRADGDPAAEESGGSGPAASLQRSPEEQERLRTLREADRAVRQHEAAHQSAGGPHAGGASFTFEKGPDGRNYAVAGEVPIDLGREAEPAATIAKMEVVKRAALAPSDPSPQDLRVAQQADAIKAQAQAEERRQQQAEGQPAAGAAAPPALAARGAAAYGAAAALGGSGPRLVAVSA